MYVQFFNIVLVSYEISGCRDNGLLRYQSSKLKGDVKSYNSIV